MSKQNGSSQATKMSPRNSTICLYSYCLRDAVDRSYRTDGIRADEWAKRDEAAAECLIDPDGQVSLPLGRHGYSDKNCYLLPCPRSDSVHFQAPGKVSVVQRRSSTGEAF